MLVGYRYMSACGTLAALAGINNQLRQGSEK